MSKYRVTSDLGGGEAIVWKNRLICLLKCPNWQYHMYNKIYLAKLYSISLWNLDRLLSDKHNTVHRSSSQQESLAALIKGR